MIPDVFATAHDRSADGLDATRGRVPTGSGPTGDLLIDPRVDVPAFVGTSHAGRGALGLGLR